MSYARNVLPLACAGVAALAACNSAMQTMTAGGTLSPMTSINPAITSADIAMLRSMSTAQQLTHLAVADSMEIAMGQIAVHRTQNGAIAEFARRMIDDHGQSLQQSHVIAQQQRLTLQPAANDTMPTHLVRMVDVLNSGTPTTEFDRTYVMSQIQVHQRMVDELQALQGIVTDEALRRHVGANIPVVESHLASAEHIAAQLGYTTAR